MRLLEAVLTKVLKALLDGFPLTYYFLIIAGDTPVSYEVLNSYSNQTLYGRLHPLSLNYICQPPQNATSRGTNCAESRRNYSLVDVSRKA